MLRSCFMALACLAIVSVEPGHAEAVKAALVPGFAISQPAATPSLARPAQDLASPKILNASRDLVVGRKPAAEPDTSATAKMVEKAKAEEPSKADDTKTAEAPKPAPPLVPTLTARIDLSSQQIVVSEDGEEKYTWAISSGTEEHPTPRGTFRPQWTAKMWYSKKYDNAPMPNAVFIHDGVAIHATFATGMLGRPASHGCIRLSPANAATFYKLVNKHGTKLTRVTVFGTPKWHTPQVASRDRNGNQPQRLAQRTLPVAVPAQAPAGTSFKNWLFGDSTPKPAPVYDPRFAQKVYRRPPPPLGYRYVDEAPRAYRGNGGYGGQRVYYVQQQPRRYYSN